MILRAGVHGVARGARGEDTSVPPDTATRICVRFPAATVTEAPSGGSIARARRSRRPPAPRPATSPARCTRRRRCTREGLRVAIETLEFGLFQFVVVVHGEDACLAEERHHEVLVCGGVVGWAETPAALHAGKLNRRLLVDAHAVSNDAQGSVPLDAGPRHHLALAMPIEIHHRKVDDGTEVGETLEHLHESAALLRGQRRRVQPHQLTIAVRGADVHHPVIQI